MPRTTLLKTDQLRDAMVLTAARWMPQRGLAAINLIEVARSVAAPRGSIYHYFPGGRSQLITEAIALASSSGLKLIGQVDAQSTTPQEVIQGILQAGRRWLSANYSGGCPVGAAVLSAEIDDAVFTASLQACFAAWESAIAAALVGKGVTSQSQATLIAQCGLIAFEGAMVYAKGTRSAQAFDVAEQMVLAMLHNQGLN
jgi:TetR/AcrR family transcriptional regulator, lmrAB and yxaGH operons repressor